MSNLVKLSLEEYYALPHPARTDLRRAAFGAPFPAEWTTGFDLDSIRAMLIEENERTGWFPNRWTDQIDEEVVE